MTLPFVVIIFVVHVFLTVLPITAGIVVAVSFGIKDRLMLLGIGLCGLLVTGYLTFWVFVADAMVGRVFTIVLTPALCVLVVCLGLPRRSLLKDLGLVFLPVTLLWVASSLLMFSFGSAYAASQPLTTSAEARFTQWELPSDNEIPLIVARALETSHRPIPQPLYGVWHSSDRPPLQAGVYLSQETALPGADSQAVHYEVVGVLLQGLWVFGIWGLLSAVKACARLTALLMTAILFSGFTLVNTFYTWPKLFAAAYLVLLAAVLLTPRFQQLRGSVLAGITVGALASASLLAHEGSGLALLAFVIVMALQRRTPTREFLFAAIAVLVVVQGSWFVYQKEIDPPGDYLARLQIAGQTHFWDEHSSLQGVIVDKYEKTPFGTVVRDKVANIEFPFESIPSYLTDTVRLIQSDVAGSSASQRNLADDLIWINFRNLVPSIGFLVVGFFGWIFVAIRDRCRRSIPQFTLAGTIWIFLGVNVMTWSLILFGPGATLIHQGTFATELLMFTACVIGLWELSRRLCTALVIAQALLTVLIYAPHGLPNLPTNEHHHLNPQMVVLASVGLSMTILALALVASGRWKGRARNGPLLGLDEQILGTEHAGSRSVRGQDAPSSARPAGFARRGAMPANRRVPLAGAD